jgi:hypothetical protein
LVTTGNFYKEALEEEWWDEGNLDDRFSRLY